MKTLTFICLLRSVYEVGRDLLLYPVLKIFTFVLTFSISLYHPITQNFAVNSCYHSNSYFGLIARESFYLLAPPSSLWFPHV